MLITNYKEYHPNTSYIMYIEIKVVILKIIISNISLFPILTNLLLQLVLQVIVICLFLLDIHLVVKIMHTYNNFNLIHNEFNYTFAYTSTFV